MSAAQEPASRVHKTTDCRQIIPLSGDLSGHDPDVAYSYPEGGVCKAQTVGVSIGSARVICVIALAAHTGAYPYAIDIEGDRNGGMIWCGPRGRASFWYT